MQHVQHEIGRLRCQHLKASLLIWPSFTLTNWVRACCQAKLASLPSTKPKYKTLTKNQVVIEMWETFSSRALSRADYLLSKGRSKLQCTADFGLTTAATATHLQIKQNTILYRTHSAATQKVPRAVALLRHE
jgi:hypothetical protein